MPQHQETPTIFIAIADYRDSECIHTLKSIFGSAAHPERIFVGVCDQYDEEQRLSQVIGQLAEKSQVRIDEMHYTESQGSGYAWNRAHALNEGETYSLQVHSHMRFLKNWDVELIAEYEACPSDKAFITYYSPPYTPPDKLSTDSHAWRRVCVGSFGKKGDAQLIHLNRKIINSSDSRQGLYPSPFIVFNFIFARTEHFQAMKFDPHIFFWGEEIAYSARLWTHGYDIYQLPNKLAYHQWHERDKTKTSDFFQQKHPGNVYSYQRMCHLFGLPAPTQLLDKDPRRQLSLFGIGTHRTLASWLDFCGVDLQKRTISDAARKGFWNADKHGIRTQNQLEPVKNSDKVGASRRQKTTVMGNYKNIAEKLVCIATNDAARLSRSLTAIFANALAPEKISVSVAWTAALPYEIPPALKEHAPRITMRMVAAPGTGNMLHEAMTAWNQQPLMIAIRAGVQPVKGWDTLTGEALAALNGTGVITQIATLTSSESNMPARIIISPVTAGHSFMATIEKQEAQESQRKSSVRELEPTPLVSFDFIAASAPTWFAMLPDPYLTEGFEEIVYSARLWTHGVPAYQVNQMLVKTHARAPLAATKTSTDPQAITRAQHMLGIAYADRDTALFELDKYGHGAVASVEEFWAAAGVDVEQRAIHPLAFEGDWSALARLPKGRVAQRIQPQPLAEKSASKPASAANSKTRIFVQIASYRDAQCQHTVKDLFEKATHPDRVFVGICSQTIPEEDADCFLIVTRPSQVRTIHFDARDSKGACWARHHTQKLWQGEEFTLQIDSHMRFVQGWDEMLLNMHRSLPGDKAVLTTYPVGFTPPATFKPKVAYKLIAKKFDRDGIFTMNSKPIKMGNRAKPVPGAFASACLLFGPATIIQDVPYDPYLYFFGEEISLSARLWTHGYDIYHPHEHIAWHDWKRENRKTTHFIDHKNWPTMHKQSFARVKYLLGDDLPTNPKLKNYVTQELERYGLGNVRSLQEYEQYSGVAFKEQRIDEKAYQGNFFEPVHQTAPGLLPAKALAAATAYRPVDISMAIQSASGRLEPFINPIRPMIATKGSKLIVPGADSLRNHSPIKTYESSDVVVYDNFLPEHVYEELYQFAIDTDYKHINTAGHVNRVWNIDNGFPLRSSWNHYYEVLNQKKHAVDSTYPLNKPNDHFIEHLNAMVPNVQHLIGVPGVNWAHYSVTSWLYPPNTGLSLHNDGAAYTGAYVYFLNKEWRIHWGGLLMVLDRVANDTIEAHKKENNAHKFHRAKWLHESEHNEYAMEVGFARTIFPKRNRMVFIAPDAYHIVSKVLPTAGDNVRMTFAGFFNRGVLDKKADKQATQSIDHGE